MRTCLWNHVLDCQSCNMPVAIFYPLFPIVSFLIPFLFSNQRTRSLTFGRLLVRPLPSPLLWALATGIWEYPRACAGVGQLRRQTDRGPGRVAVTEEPECPDSEPISSGPLLFPGLRSEDSTRHRITSQIGQDPLKNVPFNGRFFSAWGLIRSSALFQFYSLFVALF